MTMYAQQGSWTWRALPVSAFQRENSANLTALNNTTLRVNTDTIVSEDGPFVTDGNNYQLVNATGWAIVCCSATLSTWGSTSHYRSCNTGFTNETSNTTSSGITQWFQEGADESSISVCAIGKPTQGAGIFAQVYQVSGASRTIPAGQALKSAIRVSDITAIGARVARTAAQAFTANIEASISFSSATVNEGTFWVVGTPTRLTAPTGGDGWYAVVASAGTPSSTPTAVGRRLAIRLNGGTYLGYNLTNGDGGNKTNHVTVLYYLAAGDYLEARFMSTTGVSLNSVNSPYGLISMVRVSKNDHPAACIKRGAAQTIGINTNEVVQFDTVVKDDWGMSDIGGSNPERLTVPANEAGWYMAVGNHRWASNTDNFNRMCSLHVNGAAAWVARTSGLSNYATQNTPCGSVSAVLWLEPGDYVTLQVWNKNTGATRDINANEEFLSLVRIDI